MSTMPGVSNIKAKLYVMTEVYLRLNPETAGCLKLNTVLRQRRFLKKI